MPEAISIHALREEGDDQQRKTDQQLHHFYPRPPRGGRRYALQTLPRSVIISIHALREEGDPHTTEKRSCKMIFLSTPSARRATLDSASNAFSARFLSTPSARRATVPQCDTLASSGISIHALREEGDKRCLSKFRTTERFLSTPSARRATCNLRQSSKALHISIHALREEGDRPADRPAHRPASFYPRPPRGGRQSTGRR